MRLILPFVACAALLAEQANSQEMPNEDGWKFTLSAGMIAAPYYLGDDDYQLSAVPGFRVSYGDRFEASPFGLRYAFISGGPIRVGGIVSYDWGRDQELDGSPFGLWGGGGSTELLGLGDVDGTVELGGFIALGGPRYTARFELRQAVDGGHDGLHGSAELKANGRTTAFGAPMFFSFGPELSFGDDDYNSAFFDVNAIQSAASGITAFDAGGGINSIGLHATTVVPVNDHVSVIGFAGYDRLVGDVGKSTIVSERGSSNQGSAGFFLNYSF
ncbi:MipA/OmpV family protein [Roseovarius pelagicus]|uniref:MipA/OmpV family protein n=1 Tax=Roseovarius pelagicus TaxID=2980108 RepID=A0ABY6DA46_9RHOB|nr:MipA/OmpV family protein [Roseovarius pelagicus]UXX83001.1 MipA/OmpV family protein [Roseovarius pelagicus]